MKFAVVILGFVILAGVANNVSVVTLGLIMLFGYLIFSIGSAKKPSLTKLTTDSKSIFNKIDQINFKTPEGSVNTVLSDVGKISAAMARGDKADISGKTILKSTHKVINDVGSIFK